MDRPYSLRCEYPPGAGIHTKLVIRETSGEKRSWEGCGDSWCRGGCGLPLLRVHDPQRPEQHLRVFGNQVAYGPVVQETRLPWEGTELELPPELCAHLIPRYWP